MYNNLYFLERMAPSDDTELSLEDQDQSLEDQYQSLEDMLDFEDGKENWYWVSFYYLYQ